METQQDDDNPITNPPVLQSNEGRVHPIVQNLGRYSVDGVIGSGAMGIVYRAEDPLLQRRVALKVLSADLSAEDGTNFRERFFREARSAGQLSHPNIVTIYDVGQTNGIPYIAMEYLQGFTLRETLDTGNVLPIKKIVDITIRVIRGLEFAHRQGVIHRDIKPSNIMITRSGLVKILDFGIAHSAANAGGKTLIDSLIDSPRYMAPEQIAGHKLDGRSDLFSLGAVLYEMITGKVAFNGENIPAILHKVLHVTPPPPSSLNPDCPSVLDDIVLKALAKDPQARFENAREMGVALVNAYRSTQPGKYVPAAVPEKISIPSRSPTPLPTDPTIFAPRATSRDAEIISVFGGEGPSTQDISSSQPKRHSPASTIPERLPKTSTNSRKSEQLTEPIPKNKESSPQRWRQFGLVGTILTLALLLIFSLAHWVNSRNPKGSAASTPVELAVASSEIKSVPLPPPEPDPEPTASVSAGSTGQQTQPAQTVVETAPPPSPSTAVIAPSGIAVSAAPPPEKSNVPSAPPLAVPQTKPAAPTIAKEDTTPRQASAAPGSLNLSIQPWGDVYVDGAYKGASPPTKQLRLPAGRHHIVIRNSDLPPLSRNIEVRSGETTSLSHQF